MKKVLGSISCIIRNRYTLLGARLILGAIFILAAIGKIPEQAKFVDEVTGYVLLPWSLAQAYGTVLPWLELIVGVCLILGLLSRFVAGISNLMIISFIVANGTAVYKSYDAYCTCFGGGSYSLFMKSSDALVIDIVMIAMALVILLCGGGRLSLDSPIWNKLKKQAPQKKDISDGLSE